MAVVFSSSIDFRKRRPLVGSMKKRILPICESRIVSSSINLYRREDVDKDQLG